MRSRAGRIPALLLLACGAANPSPERVVERADDGSHLRVAQDELLTIELEARPSTGLTWLLESVDPGVLALAGREHDVSPALGGLDRQRLHFAAVSAGTTTLHLVYRRPWTAPSPGDPRYTLTLTMAGPYTGAWRAVEEPPATVGQTLGGGAAPAVLNLCDPGDGGYGRCTPVKDQGECGACWAFATAAVFENLLAFADPASRPSLSEQYLISCNSKGFTCQQGGNAAFDYFVRSFMSPPETAAGAVYAADFPYAGADVPCGNTSHPHHEKLASWRRLPGNPADVETIKSAMLTSGPVWTAVCADDAFADYTFTGRSPRDVFRGTCSNLNHAVVLVGWNDNGGDGYWILRNSWGEAWGDRGHMRIAYGANGVGSDSATAAYGDQRADNVAPTADPGANQQVRPAALVTLDGSGSSDGDGAVVRWQWTQTGGAPVRLRSASTPKATFVAPSSTRVLAFSLTVTDDDGATMSAGVQVGVGSGSSTTSGEHDSLAESIVGSACSTTSAEANLWVAATAALALRAGHRRRSSVSPEPAERAEGGDA